MEEMSGYGVFVDMPEEVEGWNWGAFWLTWLWGYRNEVMIGFLGLIPVINIFIMFYLGKNGNKLAWQQKQWAHLSDFKKTQRRWTIAGLVLAPFLIVFHLLFVYNFYYLEQQEDYIVEESLRMITESDEATRFIGEDVKITDYIRGSGFFFVDTTHSIMVESEYGKYWAAVRLDENDEVNKVLLSHRFLMEGFKEVIITQ